MKIAFHTPNIDVRGSCVALYDYAYYNEIILGNKSIIIAPLSCMSGSDDLAVTKFRNSFQVFLYEVRDDLKTVLRDCDLLYTIKYGTKDGVVFDTVKTVVHCVFDMSEPHGDVYAGVSETLAKKFGKLEFVPHIVSLKPKMDGLNLRQQLGIPKNAVVFGRHGGMDTFDLEFARQVIAQVVNNHSNIYFLFVNTPEFYKHPQIIYLGKIVTVSDKNKFISTCDAHLECGTLGHTFGISMAEFSVNNKPIIAYDGDVWNRAHLDILGDKGIYFRTESELYNILTTFNHSDYIGKDLNCYKDYTPEKVMSIFKKVFVDCSD